MNFKSVKKLNRLVGLMLSLLLFGCGQASQNQPAAVNSQNQAAVNNSQNQPVKENVQVGKFDRDDKLQAETDALLALFDNMPPVPVYLTDEPILKKGTNTETGFAYTHCYGHDTPSIFVKKIFYRKNNQKQIVNALKHELTHAWLCRQGVMWGHDERFRKKFRQVGGFGN